MTYVKAFKSKVENHSADTGHCRKDRIRRKKIAASLKSAQETKISIGLASR